jgi:two-component system, OmpR family, phosphate regulon sensor histidine kinase PhoR
VEQVTSSKLVRAKFFWRLGLAYLALLACVLIAVDLYSARVVRSHAIRSANEQLTSLMNLGMSHPPSVSAGPEVQEWAEWLGKSGARVTILDSSGNVLADSASVANAASEATPNQAGAEVRDAFANGAGHGVDYTRGVVSRAQRWQPASGPTEVIRMELPLTQIDFSLGELRERLLVSFLITLLAGVALSLIFARFFFERVKRLRNFSQRIARGDFHPEPAEGPRDELSELADSMNQTAAHLEREIRLLSSERNRASAILRSMVEGVAVVDAQERLVFWNRAFSEVLSLQSATNEGSPLIEVVRSSDLLGLIRRALQGEEGLQSDIAMGIVQPQNFSVTAAPVKALESDRSGPADKPSGAVVVLHDVTELRRLERVRQDFVANVSHEFKTPLTAIQGFAETLLAGALDDPKNNRRFLEIIREHAARLARVTDDLLKLARIEAGKLELEFFPVGLQDLIEGCTETTLLKASRKNISFNVELSAGLPSIRGDASLLHDVLQNLLDNAIQYTPSGGHVRVEASAGAHEATVTVSDSGIGIPLADQERIFERFYRVDAARSREAGGTGLGLSIAKHIVEAHGGRLWVESAIGRGSKFSFSIPLAT